MDMASNQNFSMLVPVVLDGIGHVVGYTERSGVRRLSSWIGATKRVWAQFNEGPLPPLLDMRDEMVAAYEPTDSPIPQGLILCICFVQDPSAPWSPRKKELTDNPICEACPEFKASRKAEARNARNCVKWLCVWGAGCPHKSELAKANT